MNAENLTIQIDDTVMEILRFGKGKKTLVMIPGLGDALASIKGMAFPFSLMYRMYCKEYQVIFVSQRQKMPEEYSTRQMAEDVFEVLNHLHVDRFSVLGISMGGMIAQHLIDLAGNRVEKLVLCVTACFPSSELISSIERWSDMLKQDRYLDFMKDNLVSMYSASYCRKNLWLTEITGRMKPSSLDRFMSMSKACMTHDSTSILHLCSCPVLLIAGGKDLVVGSEAVNRMKQHLPHAEVLLYQQLGHALYDEAKDFHHNVLKFLNKPSM